MDDLEEAILKSLHALAGKAEKYRIYGKILDKHLKKLADAGDIIRITRGEYGLTDKGCRRIGEVPRRSPVLPQRHVYVVCNEFGGTVERSRPKESASSSPTRTRTPKPATTKPMTTCPICGVNVRKDRLDKHVRKVHPASSRDTLGQQNKGKRAPAAAPVASLESLRQSDHEARFGDKYVGQSHRDSDGTFGSLPLYDDHGDEAGPE